MEFDHARNLCMYNTNDLNSTGDNDSHFARLVEQEVDRRLFQEKIIRSETEYQEKEMLRIEKERELAAIRREHEREVYLLKRQLHEANMAKMPQTLSGENANQPPPIDVSISIPSFSLKGNNHDNVRSEILK